MEFTELKIQKQTKKLTEKFKGDNSLERELINWEIIKKTTQNAAQRGKIMTEV